MEVKKGYKMTEVGVIPVDWEVKSYSEVFSFHSTANYSRAQLSTEEKISYIHYGDIHTKWEHYVDFDKNELPAISEELKRNYTLLQEGDLIMADASEDYEGIGKTVEVTNIRNREAISGLHTFLLRDKGFFVNKYRGYIHVNSVVKSQLDKFATGLKVYGVSQVNLGKIQVPVPPQKEQTAIATALSDIDNLLQAFDRLIAKKRAVKQGAMQQLLTPPQLGGKRLEGFSGEWEVKTLGECLLQNPDYGINAAAVEYQDYLPTYLRITDITETGYFDKTKLTSVDSPFSSNYVLETNDIVFARTGASTGKTYLYKEEDGLLVFAGFLIRCKINAEILHPYFLKFYTETAPYEKWISVMSMRSGQPGINGKEYSQMRLSIPSMQEQNAITNILIEMDTEIQALETQRAKYQAVKQGMMQELLMGKTRLV
jgi:type I restriction enzyme S subunit